jgi:hypothetical protein
MRQENLHGCAGIPGRVFGRGFGHGAATGLLERAGSKVLGRSVVPVVFCARLIGADGKVIQLGGAVGGNGEKHPCPWAPDAFRG